MDEPSPRKRRLFVGVSLDRGAVLACSGVCEALRKTGFAARYEDAERLHVTLAFLGFVDPARCEKIAAVLVACAQSKPFVLALDKLGAFPHERRPRVVYLGAREQGARFRELAAKVRNAYAGLGFEFDNDPVAHVTIARVKQSQRPLPLIEFVPIPIEVTALALFESLPDPARGTSRYEVIASAAL